MGTGFFFGDRPDWRSASGIALVTNRHVIDGCREVRACVHIADPSRDHRRFSIEAQRWLTIERPDLHWFAHPDPSVDLCAASLPRLLASVGPIPDLFFTPIGTHSVAKFDESRFPAMIQIAMCGYPNGLSDDYNNLPILRRGTTASHPGINFDGRSEVAVDIACFPGSSGSPIWFHDADYFASAVQLLGVLYAGPVRGDTGGFSIQPLPVEIGTSSDPALMHLGYAIKAPRVLEVAQYAHHAATGA